MGAPDYKSLSDPEIVSRCLSGDGQAWEALIMRYRRLIYSVPVKFGFATADCSDVYQTICLKLLEHLHELKDERKVSAWLITTTKRQCILMRSHRLRESSTDDDFDASADPGLNVEDVSIQTEEQQTVRDAVEELPEKCRNLLAMLYFDANNPSYEEISQKLNMPVPSIGPTRARCLEKLRAGLRRRGIK